MSERCNKLNIFTNPAFSVSTKLYKLQITVFIPLQFIANALDTLAINQSGGNVVCNFQYGLPTWLV